MLTAAFNAGLFFFNLSGIDKVVGQSVYTRLTLHKS